MGREVRADVPLRNCVQNSPSNVEVEFASAVRRAANQVFREVTVLWQRMNDGDPEVLQQLRVFIPDAASAEDLSL